MMEGDTLQHRGSTHSHTCSHTQIVIHSNTYTHPAPAIWLWFSTMWSLKEVLSLGNKPHVVIIMWYLIPVGKFTFCWTQTDQLLLWQSSLYSRTLQKVWWIWVYWFKDVFLLLCFCCVGVFVFTGAGANFSWICTVATNLRPQSSNLLEKLT